MKTPEPMAETQPRSPSREVVERGNQEHSDQGLAMRKSSARAEDGDPRRYFMRRQRSQAAHGHPRRLSSRRLPLEAVPHDKEVHSIVTTIDTFGMGLAQQLVLVAELDRYVCDGTLARGLPFETMAQAQLAEERLRLVVGVWAARSGEDAEIEYTMRSQAKGKGVV